MKIDKMSKNELQRACREFREALVMLRDSHEALMPGVKHIALQDYALLNDAPLATSRVLDKYQN